MDGSLATLVTLFATLALLGSASAQAPAQDVLTFYEVTIANAASCTTVDRQAAWLDTAVEFLECPQGWEGVTCSREVDECEGSPCENGATCTDMLAAFSCTCAPGWTGDTCAQKTVMGTLTDTGTDALECLCDQGGGERERAEAGAAPWPRGRGGNLCVVDFVCAAQAFVSHPLLMSCMLLAVWRVWWQYSSTGLMQ
jgi:hypothetical protein|eukprot:COSAG01_NODE_4538_length_4936_cov_3.306182_2_plen_197_part_00